MLQVQLQLVSAAVKLFLKKPTGKPQAMIQLVLTYATQVGILCSKSPLGGCRHGAVVAAHQGACAVRSAADGVQLELSNPNPDSPRTAACSRRTTPTCGTAPSSTGACCPQTQRVSEYCTGLMQLSRQSLGSCSE